MNSAPPAPSTGGERETRAIESGGRPAKRPIESVDGRTDQGPTKEARIEGSSRLKVTAAHPHAVRGGDMLVLPPMPRDLFEELTSEDSPVRGSTTEPETSEEEINKRKQNLKLKK